MSATPSSRTTAIEKAVTQLIVDNDYERVVVRIHEYLQDETSDLWRHIGEVLERLDPAISPFDRREATSEILKPIGRVIEDEFC
jgi:hypothetical protein